VKTIKPPARRQGEGGRLSGKRCTETRTPIIDPCPTPILWCTCNVMFELPDEEIFVSDDSFHHIPD